MTWNTRRHRDLGRLAAAARAYVAALDDYDHADRIDLEKTVEIDRTLHDLRVAVLADTLGRDVADTAPL